MIFLTGHLAITLIADTDDKSFSLMPELLYTGITNFEFRLRVGPIAGIKGSEYRKKQNDYRIDFRACIFLESINSEL